MRITNVQVTKLTRLPYEVLNQLIHSPEPKTYTNYQLLHSLQARSLLYHETLLPHEKSFLSLAKAYSINMEQVQGICFEVTLQESEEWENFEKVIKNSFPDNATAYHLDDETMFVLLEMPHSLFKIYWSLFQSVMDAHQQQELSA